MQPWHVLGRQGQQDLCESGASLVYREFQDIQDYTEKPCLRVGGKVLAQSWWQRPIIPATLVAESKENVQSQPKLQSAFQG